MSLAQQVFTNAGRSMLGRAQNGETLTITQIVVGDGTAVNDDQLKPLNALISFKLNVTISLKRDYGDGTLLVEGSFRSDVVPAAFYLRELGIMAHIGTEADRLYSVANVYADPPDYIDPAAPTIQAFKVKLVVDRIPPDNLVVTIGPSENVVGQNLLTDTDGHGVYKDAAGNILSFKRIAQGPGVFITEDTAQQLITIGAAQLNQNLDLYVPMNNPDAPPTPPPNTVFPTIQAAHDYLLRFTIPAAYRATIHVHELNHNVIHTDPINFSHPNSLQIDIIGEAPVSIPITSITPGTGGQKVCHVASTAGLAINKFVAILDSFFGYGGGCYITAMGAGTVTCNTWDQGGRPVYAKNDTGASHPRLVYLPTTLQLNTTPSVITGMINFPYGIGSVTNICAIGDPRRDAPSNNLLNFMTYIWDVGGVGGAFINCWAMCGRRGFNIYSGTGVLLCDRPWPYVGAIVASNCAFGITGEGVVVAFDRTYVNGNIQGICPSGSGYSIGSITGGMDYTIVYLNHNYYGVNCGGLFLGGSYVYTNNARAFQATNGGSIAMDAAYPSLSEYNGAVPTNGVDLIARGMAFITYDTRGQNQGTTPITTDPPADSVATADLASGQLSFIHLQNTAHDGSGTIGAGSPQDSGQPVAPQTPVIGAPGPDTPPGNVPWTPPAVTAPLLSAEMIRLATSA